MSLIGKVAGSLLTAVLALATVVPPITAVQAQEPEFYDVPFAPGQWNIGRTFDESHLRYCVDQRDPDWELAADIADNIASGLLLTPERYTVERDMIREDITVIYGILLEHCDVYMGFKLIPEGIPEWLTATRPYYESEYVFITSDPDLNTLADLAPGKPIAATQATSAHLQLFTYIQTLTPENRWPIYPMGTSDLTIESVINGTVDVSLVWAPSFWAMAKTDPAIAELRVIDPSPLAPIRLGVGGLLLANQTFLRTTIDEALAALTADGTLAGIIEEYDFPATPPQ